MGNENERKRDPAKNRENEMGHRWDEVKTGGDEKTVGLTGDRGLGGGGAGAGSVGSGGAIGGSEAFTSGDQSASGGSQQPGDGSKGGPTGSSDSAAGREDQTKHVLTGDQEGDANFGGRTGSGTSAMAANNSRDDLGASGAGSPGKQGSRDQDEPAGGTGGQSEIGGASDLGGGETGKGSGGFTGSQAEESDEPDDYLEHNGNPQAGFAERGRGAPDGGAPVGPEGTGERTANRDSDIEGSSTTR